MQLTRADVAVNLTYLATLAAPLLSLVSFGLVKRQRYAQHRRLQLITLGVCWTTVLAFELTLRLSGGSGAFLRAADPSLRPYAKALLLIHVATAVLTYIGWTWLALVSQRSFRSELPGAFSAAHRRYGKLVFAGLCFTAASASGMYLLTFVL